MARIVTRAPADGSRCGSLSERKTMRACGVETVLDPGGNSAAGLGVRAAPGKARERASCTSKRRATPPRGMLSGQRGSLIPVWVLCDGFTMRRSSSPTASCLPRGPTRRQQKVQHCPRTPIPGSPDSLPRRNSGPSTMISPFDRSSPSSSRARSVSSHWLCHA